MGEGMNNIPERLAVKLPIIVDTSDGHAPLAEALRAIRGVRGHYRVYRCSEQRSADGRDWDDPGVGDTLVSSTPNPDTAARAIVSVMADAPMGGHRYGRIERGGVLVAQVTRQAGCVVVGLRPRRAWDDGPRPMRWICDEAS
jgi:hypothetical protein